MSLRDDLLVRFSLNWAEALERIGQSTGGRVLRRCDVVATDVGRPAGLLNSVVLLEPLQNTAVPSLMSALDAFFTFIAAAEAGTVYMCTAWPVPDLSEFGWVFVEQMPLMVRLPGGDSRPAPPELRISEVRWLEELHHFEQVMINGFPVPEMAGLPPGAAFGPPVLSDERFHFWLGWHNDQPVSASAVYIAHGIINLIFLATLPEARGRGFGSALARTATLVHSDVPAMLIASSEGLPLYTRMGYEHVCDMPLWIRERP